MNKTILNIFLCGAVAAGLASCSENSWNDRYLDGFEGGMSYDNAVEGSYTLTADNYSAISKLMLAKATNYADSTAARAIASNLYFDKTSVYPASVAVPAFLATNAFPYYLAADGSSADITYSEASSTPAELAAIARATAYTLKGSDYQSVWGSETAFISSFSPEHTAAASLPSVLKAALPDATEGQYALVTFNTANENPMFGYPEATLPGAVLFTGEITAGTYIMTDVDGAVVAGNLAETVSYGYLPSYEVTVAGDAISGIDPEKQQFVLEATATPGEFLIKDVATGRYYYQSGTYNSFNVSAETNANNTTIDNYTWIITAQDNNTWKILNKAVEKWIQTPFGSYSTWGSYNYEGDGSPNYPTFYVFDESSNAEPAEIPLYTPATTTQNAVYYFNGSSWSVATGVVTLNPDDYTAMGFSNNSLSDPEIYLPLFLKQSHPYAMADDQLYVLYNRNKADLFVFDGTTWTLNNNGLETVTGRYSKTSGSWSFVKYIGKAVFNIFEADQIQLERSYLLSSNGYAATPIGKSSSYGYLPAVSVPVTNGQIVLASDENAYTFTAKYIQNDQEYSVPEGKFLIRDSYGRILYLQGTYASFNLRNDGIPQKDDSGNIIAGYLFTATRNADGTWTIANELAGRIMYFSAGYGNFAAYTSQSATDYLLDLYMLDE